MALRRLSYCCQIVGKVGTALGMFTFLLPLSLVVLLVLFFIRYISLYRSSRVLSLAVDEPAARGWPLRRWPMQKKDVLPVILITLAYAAVAFWALGDTEAPQSFCHFDSGGDSVVIELREEREISKVMYYTGLVGGSYTLEFSADGESWTEQVSMEQSYADLFKWRYAELTDFYDPVKYIRISSSREMELGEVALYGVDGLLIRADNIIIADGKAAELFDEQDIIPDSPAYLNSMYFDEIYHARTAYEHATNVKPYEISHPPLGKLLISIGIQLFGMTPFGWRFIGTLFGVLMLPILYILLKNMFGSTAIASCGTLIFAFDFMHYTQTRIATIDTYAVIFILLSYLFMYRFVTADGGDLLAPRRRGLFQLFLSGLFFGIGAASKWTVIYGGFGLALIWLLYWIFRGRNLAAIRRKRRLARELTVNILCCLVFFVVIPCCIYYASYYANGRAAGMEGLSMFFDRDYFDLVIENNKYMFTYHSGVDAEHSYSARWYQWLIDHRPILYFRDYNDYTKSSISAFVNPMLCWGGLLAMFAMFYLAIFKKDGRAAFISIGYLSQLVPWFFISRITFAYHYFPCLIFLVLALCHVFNTFRLSVGVRWKRYVFGFTALSVSLFAAFYPVLSGLRVSRWYTSYLLRWFRGSWPF